MANVNSISGIHNDGAVSTIVAHDFVPLYMPMIAFILIIFAYTYCALTGIETNMYRAIGIIGISGTFAIMCGYLNMRSE